MIEMVQSLIAHMAWADGEMVKAVAAQEGAYTGEELRKLLHHMVTVERIFLSMFEQRPFDLEREQQIPGTVQEMQGRFGETHTEMTAYAARLDEAEMARAVEFPRMKEFRPAVRDALMQVVMHSEHHRAQVALRLRALGGKPPVLDYIIWVRDVRGRAERPA